MTTVHPSRTMNPLSLRQLMAQLERNVRPCPTTAPRRFTWEAPSTPQGGGRLSP